MEPSISTVETPADFGLKEASRVTGVSLSTLRRRRDDLRNAGATQHADGTWSIPVHTLITLGMLDKVGPTAPVSSTPTERPSDAPTWDQVASLRGQLSDAQRRAAVAEAVAHERGNALEDVRRAMRMLETRTVTPAETPEKTSDTKANLTLVPAKPESESPPETLVERPLRAWWRNRKR